MLNNTSLTFFLKKMKDYLENIISILSSFKNCIDLKLMISYFIIGFSFLFNIKQWELLAGIILLVFFDFIVGILAAKMSGITIESKKVIRSVFKVFIYCIMISASHLTDKALGITDWFLTFEYATYAFLSATELISIMENAGMMGFNSPKKLLNTLKHYTCEEIKTATEKSGCSTLNNKI